MNWFEKLTGFVEESPEQVRENIILEGNKLISKVNGREMQWGNLEIPTLKECSTKVTSALIKNSFNFKKTIVREVVADIADLHKDIANQGSIFQVASQFNLLEMPHPSVTPEDGISNYELDKTQGPACAMACGAGTIYRNYFVKLDNQIGQTVDKQIDCLDYVGEYLNNQNDLWEMRNGYAMVAEEGLDAFENLPNTLGIDSRLKVGIQRDAEVTTSKQKHKVTQVYCSALPVSYSVYRPEFWEPFAQFILDSAYRATIDESFYNNITTGNNKVFLTMLGGKSFGNDKKWIIKAIEKSLDATPGMGLDISIVSHKKSDSDIKKLVMKYNETHGSYTYKPIVLKAYRTTPTSCGGHHFKFRASTRMTSNKNWSING